MFKLIEVSKNQKLGYEEGYFYTFLNQNTRFNQKLQ